MHSVHKQLYSDHRHLKRLLDWLQSQIEYYEAQDHERVELPLVLDALDYVRVHPEKWHHPLEERIFSVLLAKRPAEANLLDSLRAEHRDLEMLTQELSQLFNAVAKDCVVPLEPLVGKARQFLQQQNAHIERENNLVYPLFDQYLAADDWLKIEKEVGELRADPLFGELVKADYENLYQHIVESEGN